MGGRRWYLPYLVTSLVVHFSKIQTSMLEVDPLWEEKGRRKETKNARNIIIISKCSKFKNKLGLTQTQNLFWNFTIQPLILHSLCITRQPQLWNYNGLEPQTCSDKKQGSDKWCLTGSLWEPLDLFLKLPTHRYPKHMPECVPWSIMLKILNFEFFIVIGKVTIKFEFRWNYSNKKRSVLWMFLRVYMALCYRPEKGVDAGKHCPVSYNMLHLFCHYDLRTPVYIPIQTTHFFCRQAWDFGQNLNNPLETTQAQVGLFLQLIFIKTCKN